jgi:RNA polymerase sigma-70 factor (ECF subfamily)
LAEGRYQGDSGQTLTPEQLFDRRWALALLDQAMKRLRAECAIPYAALATSLHMSEAAARVGVHRLRRRFRELFREEIAHTVSSEELQEEIRHLLSVLSLPHVGG